MSFTPKDAVHWAGEHKWFVALIVVIVFGYALGKDIALRDNVTGPQVSGETK